MFGNMTHASMGELVFKLTQVEFKASAANCVKVHCPKKDKREEGKQEVREGRKGEERKEDHLGNSNSATQRHGENKLITHTHILRSNSSVFVPIERRQGETN